jgi:hypothetical protein
MRKNQDIRHVKVLFEVEGEDGTIDVESIWAIPTPNGHRIDNVPFYAKGLSWNDEIRATRDADGMLHFVEMITPGGHCTVRLWLANESDVQSVRDTLRKMGCSSELDLSRLVAVDIPPNVPYSRIREYLDQQEAIGVFEYEEGCLA